MFLLPRGISAIYGVKRPVPAFLLGALIIILTFTLVSFLWGWCWRLFYWVAVVPTKDMGMLLLMLSCIGQVGLLMGTVYPATRWKATFPVALIIVSPSLPGMALLALIAGKFLLPATAWSLLALPAWAPSRMGLAWAWGLWWLAAGIFVLVTNMMPRQVLKEALAGEFVLPAAKDA
jgi:hypothetical protein